MRKRLQWLIVLTLCLALLLFVYGSVNGLFNINILVGIFVKQPATEPETPALVEQIGRFWDLTENDIAQLTLIGPGQIEITNADGQWLVNDVDPALLDQAQVQTVVRRFATLEASHKLEEKPSDLTKYGLDKPGTTARAKLGDGSEKVVYLGNRHPTEYLFYAQIDGDEAVYAVNGMYGVAFQSKVEDFLIRELAAIDLIDLQYLLIRNAGQAPIEIVTGESRSPSMLGMDRLRFVSPYKTPYRVAHLENYPDFTLDGSPVLTLRVREFVDLDPVDLNQYGLDQPRGELAVADSRDSVHLLLGADRNETEVYAMLKDGHAVFTIYKNLIRIRNANPFDWVNKFLYMASIDDIRRVEIFWDDQHYQLDMKREQVVVEPEDADGEPKAELKETFYINGMAAEERSFRRLYGTIIGLTVDALIEGEPLSGEPVMTIVYYHNNPETTPFTVELLPYSRDLYAARIEGVIEFVIAKEKVDQAKAELASRLAELDQE
ncbi:MAG TPA: DUF4340 domain-containing protein [Limnochordia bacterium]|nr:DUF4340 domain-containing protein [Limnochordia bacterium]